MRKNKGPVSQSMACPSVRDSRLTQVLTDTNRLVSVLVGAGDWPGSAVTVDTPRASEASRNREDAKRMVGEVIEGRTEEEKEEVWDEGEERAESERVKRVKRGGDGGLRKERNQSVRPNLYLRPCRLSEGVHPGSQASFVIEFTLREQHTAEESSQRPSIRRAASLRAFGSTHLGRLSLTNTTAPHPKRRWTQRNRARIHGQVGDRPVPAIRNSSHHFGVRERRTRPDRRHPRIRDLSTRAAETTRPSAAPPKSPLAPEVEKEYLERGRFLGWIYFELIVLCRPKAL